MMRNYTVEGKWPFPLDMLRHDQAHAATPEDQVLINRMSGEASDEEFGTRTRVRINLVMQAGHPTRGRPEGRWLPNDARWKSFGGWTVHGVREIDERRALDEAARTERLAREAALAKLTDEDRRVLGLSSENPEPVLSLPQVLNAIADSGKTPETKITEAVQTLLNAVASGKAKAIAEVVYETVSRDHRTLQQGFWSIILLAQIRYADVPHDLRNEQAVDLANRVKDVAIKHNYDLGLRYL
jgi:hypothetical protein